MVRRIVEVCLDRNPLAGLESRVAATMGAIEIMENCAPRLGIALLIGNAAYGMRDHAINHGLVVVGVRPPGTRPIPCHGCRIVRPGNSAGNDAARNT